MSTDDEQCFACGWPLVDGDHFHPVEPYEGCDGDMSQWQVTDKEGETVALADDAAMALRLVGRLNRACTRPEHYQEPQKFGPNLLVEHDPTLSSDPCAGGGS